MFKLYGYYSPSKSFTLLSWNASFFSFSFFPFVEVSSELFSITDHHRIASSSFSVSLDVVLHLFSFVKHSSQCFLCAQLGSRHRRRLILSIRTVSATLMNYRSNVYCLLHFTTSLSSPLIFFCSFVKYRSILFDTNFSFHCIRV